MSAPAFDPYHKWLGIPPAHQPPTHYRLLGVEPFEHDPEVIEAAANQRVAYLQDLAVGERMKESQKLLNEVAAARRVLLNAEKKAAYDASIRPAPAPAAPPPSPPAAYTPAAVPAPQVYVPQLSTAEVPAYRPEPDPAAETDPAFPAMDFAAPAAKPRGAKASTTPKAKPTADQPATPATDTADGPAPLKPWVLIAGGLGCLVFGFAVMSAYLLLLGKPAKPPGKKAGILGQESPPIAMGGFRPTSPHGWLPWRTGPT